MSGVLSMHVYVMFSEIPLYSFVQLCWSYDEQLLVVVFIIMATLHSKYCLTIYKHLMYYWPKVQ